MALTRHLRLRALSGDHHHALVLARRIREATQVDPALVDEVRLQFARDLEPHFHLEERRLLPALEAAGEPELVARTLDEHRRLRALLAAASTSPAGAEALRSFAGLLEQHVRFEERTLFDVAQERLDLDHVL
jgi:hypothetical protein